MKLAGLHTDAPIVSLIFAALIAMPRGVNGIRDLNSRQVQILSVTSMLIFLSTLAVSLRFVSRRISTGKFYMDDYVIVFALLLSFGDCICQFVGVRYGLGQHIDQVGKQDEVTYLLILYVLQLFWNTTLPAIKVSILLFYRRLFPVRRLLVASSIIGAILLAWYIAIQITAIFQCLPIHYYWRRLDQGHCIQTTNFYIILASLNLATDVAILILPIPFIWHIQIQKSKKLWRSVVFLLGSFVCVTSVIRLQTLTDIDNEDITWSNVYPGLWTAIEASLGIVAACLPSLGPVLHKSIGHPLPTTQDNNNAQSQRRFAHPTHPFGDAELDGFERILESGPQGRDAAVIMNTIVRRSSASSEKGAIGTSHGTETLRKDDGNANTRAGVIVVRNDIEQDVRQRVE
ncbi:MAG: hypothetical protein ASARMPREDX12_006635 [Alectoria sarmentosa]|nr:MAG: hypothetical protein ASARMPREDX12_006635 [Alectoria sarmentosa]